MKEEVISISELEFFATQNIVLTIIPNFNDDKLYLLQGQYGQFRANQAIDVPLWLAIHLKQKQKCVIMTPFFLKLQFLNLFLENEKKQSALLPLPHEQFFEVAYICLKKASYDLNMPVKIKIAVNDLEEIRNKKIDKILEDVKGQIRINNISMYQLNKRREPVLKTLNIFKKLARDEKAEP